MCIKPVIVISNIVASINANQEINLYEIQKKFPDVEYNPKQFPGLISRLKDPKSTFLIFRTGKIICTGTTSEEIMNVAIQNMFKKLILKDIIKEEKPLVKIVNIVSTINLGRRINLVQVARTLPHTMYEPDQFPAAIHRIIDPKSVILLFASGRLVCVGITKVEDLFRAVNNLQYILEEENLISYD